jgi:hypothetical protein
MAETGNPCAWRIDPDEVSGAGTVCARRSARHPYVPDRSQGMHRKVGRKKLRWKHRKPSFYLVSAVRINEAWQFPLPIETILAWLWQRWELEVAHREMKSGFGVGEKQCWNPLATIVSTQWSVWVYALLLLSAYRTWGLLNAPPIPTRWW